MLESPPYNLIIHSAPFSEDVGDFYHWHVELMPKLTRTAGFEWGTGFYINPTSPEEAAEVLRAARDLSRRAVALLMPAGPCGTLAVRLASGNNSVVECDLAKVEVAGSNPVSRSIITRGGPSPRSARSATWGPTPTPLRVLLSGGRSSRFARVRWAAQGQWPNVLASSNAVDPAITAR